MNNTFPPNTWGQRFSRLLSWLLVILGCAYMLFSIFLGARDLWDDYLIRDTARLVPNSALRGYCEASDCRLTISVTRPDGQKITRYLRYNFLTATPPRSAVVVMSPDYPDILSTDVGLKYLTDRTLFWGMVIAFGLPFVIWGLIRLRRARRQALPSAA